MKGRMGLNKFLHLVCELIHLLTKNSFTMNTKKVFFGLVAVAFLAMPAMSTDLINVDSDQAVSVKKEMLIKI